MEYDPVLCSAARKKEKWKKFTKNYDIVIRIRLWNRTVLILFGETCGILHYHQSR